MWTPASPAHRRLRALRRHTAPAAAAATVRPPSPAEDRLPPGERDGDAESRALFLAEFPDEPYDAPENEQPGGTKWYCLEPAARNYEGGFDYADAAARAPDADAVAAREQQIGGSGGSPEPPGTLS